MLLHALFLFTLTLTVAAYPLVSRTNLITIPLARHLNLTGGAAKILETDRARASALKSGSFAKNSGTSVSVTSAAVSYTIPVTVNTSARVDVLHVDAIFP